MHFNNFALIGLVGPAVAAPLRVPGQRFNNLNWGRLTCAAIGGCDLDLSTPTKREALRPVGEDQSFCDAIGGCDGNLETPQKRAEPGFVTIDVDKLPHLSPGEIIGIGPQVEEEKREAQRVEACVMPYGCNGDPNDGPGDFPDVRKFFNDGKREAEPEPEAEEEKREAQLVEACVMPYGCNGDPNDGPGDFPDVRKFFNHEKREAEAEPEPEPEAKVEEEKREAQLEACVAPYGCNGIPNDRPQSWFDRIQEAREHKRSPEAVEEEKRSPSDTLSVNPDDLVHLDLDKICGFKGCGGVAGPVEIGSLP